MLYNIVLASAIHQHESAIGIYMSPPSGTSLPLPTLSHPSRLSQSTNLSSLNHNSKSPLAIILHMVMYMFQATPSIRPTLFFPHCVHKSVLYVCVCRKKEEKKERERGRGKKEGQRRGGRIERERETDRERKERRKEDKGMTSLDFLKKIFFLIIVFAFGWTGSSVLCASFLYLW